MYMYINCNFPIILKTKLLGLICFDISLRNDNIKSIRHLAVSSDKDRGCFLHMALKNIITFSYSLTTFGTFIEF